jgi:hypothetical protein
VVGSPHIMRAVRLLASYLSTLPSKPTSPDRSQLISLSLVFQHEIARRRIVRLRCRRNCGALVILMREIACLLYIHLCSNFEV